MLNSEEAEAYGWFKIVRRWLRKDRIYANAAYYQQEMLFADLQLRGRLQ